MGCWVTYWTQTQGTDLLNRWKTFSSGSSFGSKQRREACWECSDYLKSNTFTALDLLELLISCSLHTWLTILFWLNPISLSLGHLWALKTAYTGVQTKLSCLPLSVHHLSGEKKVRSQFKRISTLIIQTAFIYRSLFTTVHWAATATSACLC